MLQASSISFFAFSSERYLFGTGTRKNFSAPSKSVWIRSSFDVWGKGQDHKKPHIYMSQGHLSGKCRIFTDWDNDRFIRNGPKVNKRKGMCTIFSFQFSVSESALVQMCKIFRSSGAYGVLSFYSGCLVVFAVVFGSCVCVCVCTHIFFLPLGVPRLHWRSHWFPENENKISDSQCWKLKYEFKFFKRVQTEQFLLCDRLVRTHNVIMLSLT